MGNDATYNMFSDLKTPRDLREFTLFRGTTDFTKLQQFDLYESGYPYLICVSIPTFLEKMAEMAGVNSEIANLINSYKHIIEYEFRGLDSGIDDITSETQEISNGIQSINVITKTNAPSATNFSMRYYEKSGSTITKLHQLYLRSIRDPATQFKTYNGIITLNEGDTGVYVKDVGWDKECFSFLYLHTDNTGLQIENAVYFVGCMPTSAPLSIYNGTKGDIQFQEISVEFTGFPIMGSAINKRAKEILDWMNSESNAHMVHRKSWDYNYGALSDTTRLAKPGLSANT